MLIVDYSLIGHNQSQGDDGGEGTGGRGIGGGIDNVSDATRDSALSVSSSARIGNQPRGGDGAQVVHAVHQVAPAARVVVITGQPDSAPVVRKAVEEGVDEVCHKPLDVTRLLDALDRLVR